MSAVEREEIVEGILNNWGRTPVGEMCVLLVERILSIKPEAAAALSYRNLLDLTEQDAVTPELLMALNVLTTSEYAILDASGFFVDEDDESHELSAEEFEAVVLRNFLIHPDLGRPIEDPASKVSPYFSLREELVEGGGSR